MSEVNDPQGFMDLLNDPQQVQLNPQAMQDGSLAGTLGQANEFQQNMVQNQQPPVEQPTVKHRPDGKTDFLGVDNGLWQTLIQNSKELQGIKQSFMAEATQLKQREQSLRDRPLMNVLTNLAGNMAQQKDMPGWVQAAGRTNLALNPTPDALRMQRAGVEGGLMDVLQKEEANAVKMYGITEGIASKREAAAAKVAQDAIDAQNDKTKNLIKLRSDTSSSILQTGEFDKPTFVDLAQNFGATPKQAEAIAASFEKVAAAKKAVLTANTAQEKAYKEADLAMKQKHFALDEKKMNFEMALKSESKAEANAAIEALAQGIAAGDLTSLRSVTSLRGDQRIRAYARIKQLDPTFNSAELDRKVKMADSFANGRDGTAIQSFGTYLQHAGEVVDTIKGVSQSNVPLLNKTMNWWKENMAGSPEYQRLKASIETVGKEYEKFLIGANFALHDDDRKHMSEIINPANSPKQIMAALNQMSKTAKDRYGELNYRYKRTIGHDFEAPFSPEALVGAAKVGIQLPGQQPSPGTSSGPIRTVVQPAHAPEQVVPPPEVKSVLKPGAKVFDDKTKLTWMMTPGGQAYAIEGAQ